MLVILQQADPVRDKEKLLELQNKAFLIDRLVSWEGYNPFLIIPAGGSEPIGSISFGPHMMPGLSWDENFKSPGTLWLVDVGIDPDFQGQGAGPRAVQLGCAYARTQGFARVISNFRVSNSASRRLHEKCDFKPVAIISNYYRDPVEDAQVVQMLLKPLL